MKEIKTPWDYGFEMATEPKLEPNLYNPGGLNCPKCPIKESCLLKRSDYGHLCFEALHRTLNVTDICRRVQIQNKETLPPDERALHLYVDSMMYHLKTWTDASKVPMSLFDHHDLISDMAVSASKGGDLTEKYAVICRYLGRQAFEILRQRGYNI